MGGGTQTHFHVFINCITRSDLGLQRKKEVIYGAQQLEDTVKTTEEELHFSLFLQ